MFLSKDDSNNIGLFDR